MSNVSKYEKAGSSENRNTQGAQAMRADSNPSSQAQASSHEERSASKEGSKVRSFPSKGLDSRGQPGNDPVDQADMSFDALEEKIEDYGKNLQKKAAGLRRQVVQQFKKNPWAYAAGLSVGSWAIGFLMGRVRRQPGAMAKS